MLRVEGLGHGILLFAGLFLFRTCVRGWGFKAWDPRPFGRGVSFTQLQRQKRPDIFEDGLEMQENFCDPQTPQPKGPKPLKPPRKKPFLLLLAYRNWEEELRVKQSLGWLRI